MSERKWHAFMNYLCCRKLFLRGNGTHSWRSCASPLLPTTFRINGRGKFAADLRNRLEQDFFSQFQDPIEVNSSHSQELISGFAFSSISQAVIYKYSE